jgi:hypothetical protein
MVARGEGGMQSPDAAGWWNRARSMLWAFWMLGRGGGEVDRIRKNTVLYICVERLGSVVVQNKVKDQLL